MQSLDIAFSASPVVVFLLLVLAAALSFFFYRRTLPAVTLRRRIFLGTLRGIVLAFLFLALCEPLVHLVSVTRHPPLAIVLLDNSASTGIVDQTGNRAAVVAELMHDVIPASLPASLVPLYIPFGAATFPALERPPDSLDHRDELTDIASALRSLGSERQRGNIVLVILVTDGVATLGENPAYQATAPGVPVFTVGVGDTAEQRDILISRVVANELVYAETAAPVDILVRGAGYAGRKVEVTLAEGNQVLARERVVLPASGDIPAQLAYTPESEGTHRYTVRVSALEGELTQANNQRMITVRVLKNRLRLLLVAGGPGSDLALVRQSLADDERFSVKTRTQKLGSGFYEAPMTSADLDSADCLITIGMPTAATPASTVQALANAITARGKPLLFIGGKAVDTGRLLQMAPSLPVAPGPPSTLEQEVEFVVHPQARSHPLLSVDPSSGSVPWDALPPLFSTLTPFTLREGAFTLGNPRIRTITLLQPLIAMRSVADSRSLAITGYGIWRWRLMAQGKAETRPLLQTFLSNAVTWLSARDEGKSVRVRPAKDAFARGEGMEFAGQVYTSAGQPMEDARVRLVITGGGETVEHDLRSIGSGRYEGSIEGLPQGTYAYVARADRDGFAIGEDRGTFSVGGLNLEFQETRMNAGILRQIAFRSGGRYFPAAEAGTSLRRALDSLGTFPPGEEPHVRTVELAHWQVLVPLLLILLAAEWIVRRRSGML